MPLMRALVVVLVGLALPLGLALGVYAASSDSLAATPVVVPTGEVGRPAERVQTRPPTTNTDDTTTTSATTTESDDDEDSSGRGRGRGRGGDDSDNSGRGSDSSDGSGSSGDDD